MELYKENEDSYTNKDKENTGEWVFLTTAENEFEYNIIKGKLNENGITCVGKGRDFDLLDSGFLNVILGPCIPVDIMVPSEKYDEAEQIINLKISDEELEEQALNSEPEVKDGEE